MTSWGDVLLARNIKGDPFLYFVAGWVLAIAVMVALEGDLYTGSLLALLAMICALVAKL